MIALAENIERKTFRKELNVCLLMLSDFEKNLPSDKRERALFRLGKMKGRMEMLKRLMFAQDQKKPAEEPSEVREPLAKDELEHKAKQLLDAIRYDSRRDTYVDAVRLAGVLGFTVMQPAFLFAGEDAITDVSEDGKEKAIKVNPARNYNYKRLVIVHELAHYLLHYQGPGVAFGHKEDVKAKSAEGRDADSLAACILMPKVSFARQVNALKDSRTFNELVAALQEKFCVPEESVKTRIAELSLL